MPDLKLLDRLESIRPKLGADEASVVRTHLQTLQRNGIASVRQLLVALQDRDRNPEVLDVAGGVAGYLRLPEAASPLANLLAEAQDDRVWGFANDLVRLRSKEGNKVLVSVLETGTSVQQTAAAWVLGCIGEPSAIPLLRAVAMSSERTIDVRAHAAEALGALTATESVPDLVELLTSDSPELRYWSAYALGEIGDPSCISVLEQMAANETAILPGDRSLKQEALDAIAKIRAQVSGEATDVDEGR